MKRLLTLILVTLPACGDVNLKAPEGKTQDASSDAQNGPENRSDDKGRPLAGGQGSEGSATVSCMATATATVAKPVVGATRPMLDWHFTPGRKTYAEAAGNAPVGYRLPTRVELIEGVDSGDLKGYYEVVWSSTPRADATDKQWTVRLSNGMSIETWVEGSAQTIYVKEIRE